VLDEERCYRAVQSRDARFDGWFYTGVVTTGIYCRPSCPALTPRRANVRFFPSAAAAQGAGFRACKRCRPDASPGSPEWDVRADVVARAMRLIADGVVDREGVQGLARRLGFSARQVHRLVHAELGAGPLALARAQRAHTARNLLERTDLSAADVAFAAGFASVRQFNDTVREVFAATPTELRRARPGATPPGGGGDASDGGDGGGWLALRLAWRGAFDACHLFGFLGARAVPGVEEGRPGGFRRTLDLPHGVGLVDLRAPAPGEPWVHCRLRLDDLRDVQAAVRRTRRLLDLDADPDAVVDHLGRDPLLGARVRHRPGIRSPGAVDGPELAVRAVLGQQVSVAAARTLAGRLVAAFGAALDGSSGGPSGGLTHRFPRPDVLAGVAPGDLPLPAARAKAVVELARALAEGTVVLDGGADRDRAEAALLALPGIGPWTAAYVRLRALGDPDVFLPTDGGVRRALAALGGAHLRPDAPAAWRPWRSYALHHLWATLPGSAPHPEEPA